MSKQAKKLCSNTKTAHVAVTETKMYCRERILALNETNFFVNSQISRMDYKRLKAELDKGYQPPEIVGHVPLIVEPHSNIVLFPTKRMRNKTIGYDIKEDMKEQKKRDDEKALVEALIDRAFTNESTQPYTIDNSSSNHKARIIRGRAKKKRTTIEVRKGTTLKKQKKSGNLKDVIDDWEKEVENDIFKFYSGAYHATTCMMYATAFCAAIPHASVPLQSGMRVSLQLQIEAKPNCNYPFTWPQEYSAGIPMDDKDPLYTLMKINVEKFLGTLVIPTNCRQAISIKYGSATHWENLKTIIVDDTKKDTDLKTGICAFYAALDQSKNTLDSTAKRIIGGSLGHLIIDVFGVSKPTDIRDLRLVYGSSSSGFRIHDDTGHSDGGSRNSITVHMNLFRTKNYVPGYQGSGPWKMTDGVSGLEYQQQDDSVCNEFPYIDGYLGERLYRYSKSECCFLKKEEGNSRDVTIWPELPSKKLCSIILSDYQNVKVKKGEDLEEIFRKHNVSGKREEGKGKKKKVE